MDKLPRNLYFLIAGILFSGLLIACLSPSGSPPKPVSEHNEWAEALRALDQADTSTPAYDLTAVYLRQQDEALQIRFDLLDFDDPYELSIDLQIDDASAPWIEPYNLHIPSENLPARISLDPLLATAIITIPFSEIPSHPRVDVSTPEDQITGLTLDGPLPTQTAPLLLTFYDTFAARFPAEALRACDGAHSGPRGERHGLKHLLDAAEEYQVPLILLDLKKPENLSALDAMGLLPRVQELAEQGWLILPENSSDHSDEAQFGFSPSPSLYDPLPGPWSKYDGRFVFSDDTFHLYHWVRFPMDSITYIPIATETDANQPTPNGPSLEIRRALLETALNADKKDLLVLGGSFANSTWGSPDMVGHTLAYIASRPYIKLLSETDLPRFPTVSGRPTLLHQQSDAIFFKMNNDYARFNGRVMDYAEYWNEHLPEQTQMRCDLDIDWDDQDECILASQRFLAVLDPQGARLTYFFSVARIGNPPESRIANSRHELHQLIGPSWQVAVGLSDPSTWQPGLGEAADPGAYPGAFVDEDDPFKVYEPAIEGDTLMFTSTDGTRAKTFHLTETGLEVKYQTQEPVTTQIPLLVDPWTRFTPGWAENYTQQNLPGGIAWGLESGPMVNIQFDGEIKMHAFSESLLLLNIPEDPDFDYPPGHTIPFPMAIAEVEMQDGYFLRLECLP